MTSTLILLPGLDGTGDLFQPLISELDPGRRIVRIGYPPDRSLSVDQLASFVGDRIPSAGPYVFVAESFSSLIAIKAASENSSRLCGLILCGGFVSSPVSGWRRSVFSLLAPVAFRLPISLSAIRHWLLAEDTPDDLCEFVRNTIGRVPPSTLESRLRQVLHTNLRHSLARIEVPLLYMQATGDRLVPPTSLQEILACHPSVEVAILNAPHLMLQARPSESARIIEDFLSSCGA